MKTEITIDKAGRIVLPKDLRQQLHLSAGDILDLTVEAEQITLRPRQVAPPLQKERGVWVFRTGQPLTTSEVTESLHQIRNQRARQSAGDAK